MAVTIPGRGLNGINTAPYEGRQGKARWNEHALEVTAALRVMGRSLADRALLVAILSLVVNLICLVGVLWFATRGIREVPYVVTPDGPGQYRPLVRVDAVPMTPEQSVVHSVLQQWMEWARWITNDPRAFALAWEHVEDFTTSIGLRQLLSFRQEQWQRQQAGTRVQVTILNVLPIAKTGQSYTVEWCEEAYDAAAQLIKEESLLGKAVLLVADFQGKVAAQERDLRRKADLEPARKYRNLMGIFVHEISWTFRPLPPGRTCHDLTKAYR